MVDTVNVQQKVKLEVCRSCASNDVFLAIDLGELPISNELNQEARITTEVFPLRLQVCKNCSLGQVGSEILPTRLFSDYRYLSSVSSSFLFHAQQFCEGLLRSGMVSDGDLVMEIACNDGYLLKNFVGKNVKILGIEPSTNVSQKAKTQGIPVINDFFGSKLARQLVDEYGFPKIVIANNVMAHVPELQDFVNGLSILCGPETIVSVENPSILNILNGHQFDTIYHEHFSYLSCNSVDNISKRFGLTLFDLEELSTHGGSNRYWLKKGAAEKSDTLLKQLQDEKLSGISDEKTWKLTSESITKNLVGLREWLKQCYDAGETVLGYGAAAKASTLLNAADVPLEYLSEICDLSEEKIGRYIPKANYKVINYENFIKKIPDNVLIFPWNISKEISEQIKIDLPGSKLWVAIPSLKRIH
jgi:hypothetical protein